MNTDKHRYGIGGLICALIVAVRAAVVLAILIGLWCLCARGSDINKGYTFTLNEHNITHTKLNNLVDGATINSSFFTDKSATTTAAAADVFLMYQSSGAGYRKITISSLLYDNTGLITGQAEDTSPATNDYVLTYDTSATGYKKVALGNLFANTASTWPAITNPPPGDLQFVTTSNGVPYLVGTSNVFSEWWRWERFTTNGYPTNIPLMSLHAHPTNLDYLLIWDAVNGTNKATTLIGLLTNLPAATALTNTDAFLMVSYKTNANNPYGTNPTVSKVAYSTLGTVPTKFTTNGIPVNTTGLLNVSDHLLGAVPQVVTWTLVCTNTDSPFAPGNEVDCDAVYDSSTAEPVFGITKSATSLVLTRKTVSTPVVRKSDTGGTIVMDMTKWTAKAVAIYFP